MKDDNIRGRFKLGMVADHNRHTKAPSMFQCGGPEQVRRRKMEMRRIESLDVRARCSAQRGGDPIFRTFGYGDARDGNEIP